MNVNPVQEAMLPLSVKILSTVETSCATNLTTNRNPGGKCLYFWRYPNFLKHSVGLTEESLHTKTSSVHLVVSIQYRIVTDGRTERLHNSIYYTSISSRDKNQTPHNYAHLKTTYRGRHQRQESQAVNE